MPLEKTRGEGKADIDTLLDEKGPKNRNTESNIFLYPLFVLSIIWTYANICLFDSISTFVLGVNDPPNLWYNTPKQGKKTERDELNSNSTPRTCISVLHPASVRNGLGARAAPRGNCQEDWTGLDDNFYSVLSWDILGLQGWARTTGPTRWDTIMPS